MSSQRGQRRKNRIAGQFSPRTIEMMESPAFRALTLAAHRVLARIEIEHAHHGGNDNGRLPVTFNHFVEYGVHRHAIAPALRELCALGFIEITERGRAGNAEFRRPNLFRLTYRYLGNADPTDEWRHIRTKVDAERITREARTPVIRRNKTPVSVSARSRCGNRHRKSDFHNTESNTTSHSSESATTSTLSGTSASARASNLSCPISPDPLRVGGAPTQDQHTDEVKGFVLTKTAPPPSGGEH
jgi:hypothetical protein